MAITLEDPLYVQEQSWTNLHAMCQFAGDPAEETEQTSKYWPGRIC